MTVWSVSRWEVNVEKGREVSCRPWQSVCHNLKGTDATHSCMPVSHAAHDSLLATTEQLQMSHTAVCQSLMQPVTVCLPQLNSYRYHTQLYACLSCSPWQSFCHNWTATDATHNCMPISHAAHDSLFATTEQLQMPHTAVCQSLMQPMTVSLPQLNSYRCHTQLYARLSCSSWQSVCHNWTATDSTHSCVSGCEIILAVAASWLIPVCGFCLSDECLMSGGF